MYNSRYIYLCQLLPLRNILVRFITPYIIFHLQCALCNVQICRAWRIFIEVNYINKFVTAKFEFLNPKLWVFLFFVLNFALAFAPF